MTTKTHLLQFRTDSALEHKQKSLVLVTASTATVDYFNLELDTIQQSHLFIGTARIIFYLFHSITVSKTT